MLLYPKWLDRECPGRVFPGVAYTRQCCPKSGQGCRAVSRNTGKLGLDEAVAEAEAVEAAIPISKCNCVYICFQP